MIIPLIQNNNMQGDIFSTLLKDGIITIGGEITDEKAMLVNAEMMYLASTAPDRDIQLYISSPGGSVSAGLSIYDTMQRIKPDVVTIASGCVASMAAILLSGGTKGKRYAEKHSEIMIHQPSSGVYGQESDIRIVAEHIAKIRGELNIILSENCGKSLDTVAHDTDRDFWMKAEEALEYGIIDKVL